MSKIFILFLASMLALTSLQAFAAPESVNIKVKISGAASDNRYFLCMRGVGCLSILAAQRGKVFPIFRSTTMSAFFIQDVNKMRLSPQGLPASCQGRVDTNKTVTITGSIVGGEGDKVRVSGLHCTIS